MAEVLRNAVAASVTYFEGKELRVTVSLGVAQYRPGDTADSLVMRADTALYRAKAQGRDHSEREAYSRRVWEETAGARGRV